MAIQVDIEKKLKGFHLRVKLEAGDETLALLGASGSGKSMCLRCIAGVEKPDRGRIVLNGRVLYDSEKRVFLPPQKRRAGLMFQNYALFPNMTVRANIEAGSRRLSPEERTRAAEETMEAFGIRDLANRLPSQLSGGQQQRVALARLLASRPEAILLDEPFSALDTHLRFRMEREVHSILRSFGGTVILVSHDRDEVYRLADRTAILESGRVSRTGTIREVFSDPGTRAACLLTGCKNVSPIRRLDENHAEATDWGITLELALHEGTDAVGIRMHSICPGPGKNAILCRVAEVIENPFSVTVMLRPETGQEVRQLIGWETEKETWRAIAAEKLTVHLPENALMQLKG